MRKYEPRPGLFEGHTLVPAWIHKTPDLTRREKDLFALMHVLTKRTNPIMGFKCLFWKLDKLGEKLTTYDAAATGTFDPHVMDRFYMQRLMHRLRDKKYVWTWRLQYTTRGKHRRSANLYVLRPGNMKDTTFWMQCNTFTTHYIDTYLHKSRSPLRAEKKP